MTRIAEDKGNRLKLRSILGILNLFKDADAEMPVQQQIVLVWVSLNEGQTQKDMRLALDMASSTASRNLNALSKYHRLGKEGLHFIDLVDSPEDRRQKQLFLTEKGKSFLGRMLDQI